MIIDHRNFQNIDFKKYKRIFISGCSFTNYAWPSWATILTLEAPQAEKFNFAQSGGGNLFIAERIIAANQKYRFTKDDLVLMMWSTFAREDRYIKTCWETPGNIWTQSFYPPEFVKKYSCIKGYIVRDMAVISMMKLALKSLPCDSVMLKSVDPEYEKGSFEYDDTYDVLDLYRDVMYDMGLTLYHFQKDGHGGWINGHHYHWPNVGGSTPENPFKDYHPNPEMYKEYLLKMGFKLSQETQNTAIEWNRQLQNIKTRPEIDKWHLGILNNIPTFNIGTHLI
jgi:hypothetical protein